jgi:hypothetical protein
VPLSPSGENKWRLGSVTLQSQILSNEGQKVCIDHHQSIFPCIIAVTMASVQLELARDDQNDIQTGTCLALHEDCTPSVLISTGLELKEQQ